MYYLWSWSFWFCSSGAVTSTNMQTESSSSRLLTKDFGPNSQKCGCTESLTKVKLNIESLPCSKRSHVEEIREFCEKYLILLIKFSAGIGIILPWIWAKFSAKLYNLEQFLHFPSDLWQDFIPPFLEGGAFLLLALLPTPFLNHKCNSVALFCRRWYYLAF